MIFGCVAMCSRPKICWPVAAEKLGCRQKNPIRRKDRLCEKQCACHPTARLPHPAPASMTCPSCLPHPYLLWPHRARRYSPLHPYEWTSDPRNPWSAHDDIAPGRTGPFLWVEDRQVDTPFFRPIPGPPVAGRAENQSCAGFFQRGYSRL